MQKRAIIFATCVIVTLCEKVKYLLFHAFQDALDCKLILISIFCFVRHRSSTASNILTIVYTQQYPLIMLAKDFNIKIQLSKMCPPMPWMC